MTLRRILSHPKDHVPYDDKSNVVYKISCRDCDAIVMLEKLKEH